MKRFDALPLEPNIITPQLADPLEPSEINISGWTFGAETTPQFVASFLQFGTFHDVCFFPQLRL
jgi:hypothetical protein